jgi:hypothetical protein
MREKKTIAATDDAEKRGACRRRAVRDATATTIALALAIYAGSGRLAHLDHALLGYLLATLVATWGLVYRLGAFWRRPASAFYARALFRGLRRPSQAWRVLHHGGRDLVAQRFIGRRHWLRWLAHMLLSWGTLASVAVTVPLVWGWMRFEAVGDRAYRVLFWSVPGLRFDADGLAGWMVFHVLHVAAVAVIAGAITFLALRLRRAPDRAATHAFHVAPLLLLLAVAGTGLALPLAAHYAPGTFAAAALVHELTVIVLLIALPLGKLTHVLIRPLQLGSRLVRAEPDAACLRCGVPLAPVAQLAAVASVLAARGLDLGERHRVCPPCRRRELARVHSALLGTRFQPALRRGVAARPLREVA